MRYLTVNIIPSLEEVQNMMQQYVGNPGGFGAAMDQYFRTGILDMNSKLDKYWATFSQAEWDQMDKETQKKHFARFKEPDHTRFHIKWKDGPKWLKLQSKRIEALTKHFSQYKSEKFQDDFNQIRDDHDTYYKNMVEEYDLNKAATKYKNFSKSQLETERTKLENLNNKYLAIWNQLEMWKELFTKLEWIRQQQVLEKYAKQLGIDYSIAWMAFDTALFGKGKVVRETAKQGIKHFKRKRNNRNKKKGSGGKGFGELIRRLLQHILVSKRLKELIIFLLFCVLNYLKDEAADAIPSPA